MDTAADPRKAPLIDLNAFGIAAMLSIATVILLVVYMFVLGAIVSLAGGAVAFFATTERQALVASRLISIGLGVWAGPAVYFGLWALQGF